MTYYRDEKNTWIHTPNFYNGIWVFKNNIRHICGDDVFGYGKGRSEMAVNNVIHFLEKSDDLQYLKSVKPCKIINKDPTYEELVCNLLNICKRSSLYFKKFPKTKVKDNWAYKVKNIKVAHPVNKSIHQHKKLLEYGNKRFTGYKQNINDTIKNVILDNEGILAELYVLSFLNNNIKCPECKVNGKISSCEQYNINCSDSFRDGICMNCYNNDKLTLFEIKTRWEKDIKNKNFTHAGSFVALNVLFSMKANVYLVVVSRDTGTVRLGKITTSKPRANKNWLYSLQENFKWGSPSSLVICKNGLHILPNKMKPLKDVLTKNVCNKVSKQILEEITICSHCDSKEIQYCYSTFSSYLIPICEECKKKECCVLCGWETGETVCNSCSY